MTITQYFLLFLLPVLGGLQVFFFKKADEKYIRLLLTFSGAYLFGIIILHLMPVVFTFPIKNIGLYILIGFIIQILIDQLSQGVEHGHMHVHGKLSTGMLVSIMAGLSFHALMEGIPLAGLHVEEVHNHVATADPNLVPLLFGIAIHKIPAAFALMAIFVSAKVSVRTSIVLLCVFALMTPLSTWLTTGFSTLDIQFSSDTLLIIYAIVMGSFLHISTTILFEVESKIHSFNLLRMLVILTGIGLAFLTSL
jgi:zinc and cadmium transporter